MKIVYDKCVEEEVSSCVKHGSINENCIPLKNKWLFNLKRIIKRLLFYWGTSFTFAIILYYILLIILPHNYVFGGLYRMLMYHTTYPIFFIMIPCFFYGIIATVFAETFFRQTTSKRILLTFIIIFITIFLSSPFWGMLRHYYDMKAGYFPSDWITKMIQLGFEWGLEIGWLIIMLSIPYNIIGSIACYFLTKKGAELFHIKD